MHLRNIYRPLLALFICFNVIYAIKKSSTSNSRISINGKWFVDEYGRVRMFRGLNAVQKSYPWVPTVWNNNLTNQTHLDNLKLWGFNVVRLGVMWSGVRPDKNTINQTYIDQMVSIINDLASRDIYVIIDMHQDMMSSKFNSYDGVPRWLVDMMPNSTFPYPWPFKNPDLVFAAYLTESCGFAFQNLYDNVNGFQDYFAEYWTIIAKTLYNHTSVLGYEAINEPWAGDVYAHPDLFLPARAGRNNLMPMYDNLYAAIRKYDQNTIVFYEPVTWGVDFNGNNWGTGFNVAPGNDPNRTALSWHYYCWLLNFYPNPLVNGTYPVFDRIVCDELQRYSSFQAVRNDMAIIGSPSFLTEFGVCAFDTGNGTLETTECQAVLDAADDFLQSWTYWDSNFYYDNFQPNDQLLKIFSRVYPISTSGTPINFNFNKTSRVFTYMFMSDPTIQQPTEIYIPGTIYPLWGIYVSISDHLQWKFDADSKILLITTDPNWNQPLQSKVVVSPTD